MCPDQNFLCGDPNDSFDRCMHAIDCKMNYEMRVERVCVANRSNLSTDKKYVYFFCFLGGGLAPRALLAWNYLVVCNSARVVVSELGRRNVGGVTRTNVFEDMLRVRYCGAQKLVLHPWAPFPHPPPHLAAASPFSSKGNPRLLFPIPHPISRPPRHFHEKDDDCQLRSFSHGHSIFQAVCFLFVVVPAFSLSDV